MSVLLKDKVIFLARGSAHPGHRVLCNHIAVRNLALFPGYILQPAEDVVRPDLI